MTIINWIRTPRTLRILATSASTCQDNISLAFARGHVALPNNEVAWGQYIDRHGSRQTGLYGAAAAAGTLKPTTMYADMRNSGIAYLLRRYDGRRTNSTDRYQFALTPKIAGFLRAFGTPDLTNPRISKACLDLIAELNRCQIPDSGWGFYTTSEQPDISATSLLLLAICDLGLSSHLNQGQAAAMWLARQAVRLHRAIHPGELALALHAVRSYQESHPETLSGITIKVAHKWLIRQLRLSSAAWMDYLVSYTAINLKGQGRQENDEYFMMPSTLMALQYLVDYHPFDLMRPSNFRELKRVINGIASEEMYKSPMNHRASSRENQWASDICSRLRQRYQASPATLSLFGYIAGFNSLLSRNVLVYATLLFMAVFPSVYGDPGLLVGGFALAVLASIVAGAMIDGQ